MASFAPAGEAFLVAFATPAAFLNQTLESFHRVDPLSSATILMLVLSFLCWALAAITDNYSWTDRLWSVAPIAYAWLFVARDGQSARLVLMASLVTIWGARLTFNFAKRGGYRPSFEDHRWRVVRSKCDAYFGAWLFPVFNVVFVALYQNFIVLGMVCPMDVAWRARANPLSAADVIVAIAFLALVIFEAVADHQQFTFQTEKHLRIATRKPLDEQQRQGFLSQGLFRFSRHPNYFAEMSIWWVFYAFSVACTGVWVNWSGVGTVALTLLFQGSTPFTEHITMLKYPRYADYQRSTSRLIPWFPGDGSSSPTRTVWKTTSGRSRSPSPARRR